MPKIEAALQKQRATEARTDAKRMIFLALTEYRRDGGDCIPNDIDRCHELADKLFELLNEQGLLRLHDEPQNRF
jgi:hypothetical protein